MVTIEKDDEPTAATTNQAGTTKVSDEEYKTLPFSTQNSMSNVSPLQEIGEEDEDAQEFNVLSCIELTYCSACHLE